MPGIRQPLDQHAMEPDPDAGCLPVTQLAPTGHARAAELTGQHLPGNAGAQDEDDADQGKPVIASGAAISELGPLPWQKQRDGLPQIISHKALLMVH